MGWEDEVNEIAGADQQQAGHTQFALMLRKHYMDLIAAGFTKVEALHLTANYQTACTLAAAAKEQREG